MRRRRREVDEARHDCQSRSVKSCGPSGSQDLALLRSQRGDPLPFLEGVHPSHADPVATGRNRRQWFSLVRAVFRADPFAAGCHRLRPLCSLSAPFPVAHEGNAQGTQAHLVPPPQQPSRFTRSDFCTSRGSCTVTRSPPAARGVRVRVPSCAWVMLLTIARPRPTPAWSVRMRSVPRRNGSPSVETNCGVSFSPVFSTVSNTLLG